MRATLVASHVESKMNLEIAPKSTEIQSNWHTAMSYCENLNIDGKTGWRLPTKEELNEIYKYNIDFEKDWYWSSTEAKFLNAYEDNVDAWIHNFFNGNQHYYGKVLGTYYIRAIRSIV